MMTSLELRKFRPLVKFMQKMLQEEKLWRVRTQRVRGALDLEPDDIIQATQLGLVVRAEGTGPTRIMLTPGAEYVTERTVYLTGALRSCVPLVQYLAEQASAGFHEINAATIRRRFGQEVEEVITDAKAQGVVEDVPNAPNRKIRLCPHTQVVF
ncbi:uncharacterized protein PHACADRAFT_257246 [Phanerochaete carnosa HHB-10118-sp]|uniref:Uncharacterized protein n=1 Tax=Phanerochaete carnosa (strain HHB-10118-sp) TaxID=650164 RepID=K5WAB6_PHACS|nr:uncharacterized protein PHACADRAFT_257246 [Phanerochaete carnosa HHB-10118-sp]EKM56165.1 hypothetical protein PHACADRAFT_257246 [Phanerochaete carnosa HHB-10118-sp]